MYGCAGVVCALHHNPLFALARLSRERKPARGCDWGRSDVAEIGRWCNAPGNKHPDCTQDFSALVGAVGRCCSTNNQRRNYSSLTSSLFSFFKTTTTPSPRRKLRLETRQQTPLELLFSPFATARRRRRKCQFAAPGPAAFTIFFSFSMGGLFRFFTGGPRGGWTKIK